MNRSRPLRRTTALRRSENVSKERELEERFWSKVNKTDGCWLWTANVGIGGRYGSFSVKGKDKPAHRVAYELVRGPIPDGLELDHLCSNTICVNPDHLEPVTHVENMRRGNGWAGENARKTHCARHGNPLVRIGLRRGCRECRAEDNRNYRLRKGGTGSISEGNRRRWAMATPEEKAAITKKIWTTRRRNAHKDPVLPHVRNYVLARDRGCVGVVVDMEGPCDGRLELDHVDNAGLGKRGPSTADNLVALCSAHHRTKTEAANAWRPLLRAYLARVEGRHAA